MSTKVTSYAGIVIKKEYIVKVKEEGVTDEDLELWWSFYPDGQKEIIKQDNTSRMAFFLDKKAQGADADEAAEALRKAFPIYGDPADQKHTSGNDRPLPYELKDRVNRYVERVTKEGKLHDYKKEIDEFSTYNAFVRDKIRNDLLG